MVRYFLSKQPANQLHSQSSEQSVIELTPPVGPLMHGELSGLEPLEIRMLVQAWLELGIELAR